MPDKEKSIERIERQINEIDALKESKGDFTKWRHDTQVVIEKTFGTDTRHLKSFNVISYSLSIATDSTPRSAYHQAFCSGLERARSILKSFVGEIAEYWDDTPSEIASQPSTVALIDSIEAICQRFHIVSRQLRSRYNDRPTIEIEDEYDVQDLMHALLLLHFDDVRREEWNPSYAGASSRADFLLKRENVVVEVKKTRKGLDAKQVGEQLMIDIQRYKVHPNCTTLVCFVYDPDGRVANPRGLESDLNGEHQGVEVKVIVAPSGV